MSNSEQLLAVLEDELRLGAAEAHPALGELLQELHGDGPALVHCWGANQGAQATRSLSDPRIGSAPVWSESVSNHIPCSHSWSGNIFAQPVYSETLV
jgi:rhodanese-related sulfurtransferase